jgi:hypothetical protein
MAAATAITSRRGNDQFRGVFSDTWVVTSTLDTASLTTGSTTTDTVAVPGVVLGDMVIGLSAGVTLAGLQRTAYVSAANVVTIVTQNPTAGTIDLAATTVRVVVARMV